MTAFLLLCLVALLSCASIDAAPLRRGIVRRPPVRRDVKVFNVLSFGARPDGKKQSTMQFVRAWNAACQWRGRARLVIPAGTYLTGQVVFQGPCLGPPPIIVQVQGTIKALTDVSEYPSPEWFSFEMVNGLVLTGGGTFDGQGGVDWKYNDCRKNSNCELMAANMKFNHVTNGQIRRITSINSKSFHITINNCNNIGARRLNIIAPEESPNTDGIHISETNSIRISNSIIRTGDDCISIGQGTTNITVSKVQCGPGHGISIGSLGKYPDEKDVTGVIVRNCTLTNTENGVRIKTWPGSSPSRASGFLFENIVMNNVRNPIIIDQRYCAGTCKNGNPSRVQVSDVHYRDIRGTSASDVAVALTCSQQLPCQNVQMFNINLKYTGKKPNVRGATSACSNAKVGFSGIQIPPPCRSVS